MTLTEEIAEYAAHMAGTGVDLDEELEAAGCTVICDTANHIDPFSVEGRLM